MKELASGRPLFQQVLCPFLSFELLSKEEYKKSYERTEQAFQNILHKAQKRAFPFLEQPFSPELSFLKPWIQQFQAFRLILVFDIGATATGMEMLTNLVQSDIWTSSFLPRICFLSALDPEKFWEAMSIANPQTTGILVFSSSQEEEGTVLYLMRCLEYWKGLLAPEELARHILVVAGQDSHVLGRIAQQFQLDTLEYPSAQDGISCFSALSFLPAMVIGFEGTKFCKGAALTCNQFFSRQLKTPLEFIALLEGLRRKHSILTHFFIPYGNLLESLVGWYQGISSRWIRERKDVLMPLSYPYTQGLGITKMPQFFTLFMESQMAQERLAPETWETIPELRRLSCQSLAGFMQEQFKKFHQTLHQTQQAFRVFQLHLLNEEVLGALLMAFTLENLLFQEVSSLP